MKNGRCVMCGSDNVYENPELGLSTNGASVSLCDRNGIETIVFSFVPYVCLSCGFVALYVSDAKDLREIPNKKGWKKVNP